MADRRYALIGHTHDAAPAEVNDLTTAVTWANVPDANITQSSVTQHETALQTLFEANNWAFSAKVRLTGTGDAGLATDLHPFQVGNTGAINLIMDGNELMARNNGAASQLHLNADGGASGGVIIGDATTGTPLTVKGAVTATSYGGITEANLLDKTAAETVSGIYEHSAAMYLSNSVPLYGRRADTTLRNLARIDGSDNTVFGANDGPHYYDAGTISYWRVGGTQRMRLSSSQLIGTSISITGFTSIEGITSANLVDKSAAESITGAWDFSDAGNPNPGVGKSNITSDILHLDGKEAIDGADTFLRLNQNGDFTGGVYTPGLLRGDGGLQVGGVFTVASGGQITAVSYGGIAEASLLDKSAAEVVSGNWQFTGAWLQIASSQPNFKMWETDAAVDEKLWKLATSAGDLYFQARADDDLSGTNWLRVNRTGTSVDSIAFTGPVTATSFGGITQANLLDKDATETVTGLYTFTRNITISKTQPILRLNETDASANNGWWRIEANGEKMLFRTDTDAGSGPLTWMSVDRTGEVDLRRPHSQFRLTDTDDASYMQMSSSSSLLAMRISSTSANHFFLNATGMGFGIIPSVALHINGASTITGKMRLPLAGDAGLGTDTHAFQVGTTGSTNVIIDNNEIMARNNGAISELNMNADGGAMSLARNTGLTSFYMRERASAGVDTAALGQLWFLNNNPNEFWFTDGDGNDHIVAGGQLTENYGVAKTTNEGVISSTTLQNDDELVLPVLALQVYNVKLWLKVNQSDVGPGIKWDFAVPSGSTGFYKWQKWVSGGSSPNQEELVLNWTPDQSFGLINANTVIIIDGTFTCGATGGNLQFRFAQNSSSTEETQVEAGSSMMTMRIA